MAPRYLVILIAGLTGILAPACSNEAPEAEETITEDPGPATTPQPPAEGARIQASMATTPEEMCRSAFYDENNQLVLGGQIDLTDGWCECFVTDIPINAEQASYDTLPRDGDYMADLNYAVEEIARRRDFDELDYQEALDVLQDESAEIQNTELSILLDAVTERVTKTYADMLDESGACDRAK
ncbi:MAG: hypothetical protein WA989_07855 [Henriciella sp.]|uniref:hypothetical protein n=1 Tax=Henriciella sp. TaxID=1968823 RepID=UPI003C72DEFA